jgi:hypothetical protein
MTDMPLLMAGFDRRYLPPRSVRGVVSGDCTAWDLFYLEADPVAGEWASGTLDALLASVESADAVALGCTDCADIGYYGIPDPSDPDLLVGLVRRNGDSYFEKLDPERGWVIPDDEVAGVEILDIDVATDLAAAITAGAGGLLRRYGWPRAFLPPAAVVAAAPLSEVLRSLPAPRPPENLDGEWVNYAVVDEVDQGAVIDVVRLAPDASGGKAQRWDGTGWVDDPSLFMRAELPLVPLGASLAPEALVASGRKWPENETCEYCKEPATKRILHSEGMAYIVTCDADHARGLDDAAHCTPDGTEDLTNICWVHPVTADAGLPMTADAPLTVSPHPKAEKLRRYWSTGRGGVKIRWMTGSDWRRCYRHLRKYMGVRAKGYCANLHKRNTGMWPGDRRNRGLRGSTSPEEALLASIRTGQWGRTKGRTPEMPLTEELLTDGEYSEVDHEFDGVLATITAGGFPVAPDDQWFENPRLTAPTPLVVQDDGRVFGHIAEFGTYHIGMAGKQSVPHSKTNYAYFRTGVVAAASGKQYNVGQLTLTGGHAPLEDANRQPVGASAAVKHYDDTSSAVADVTAGEDRYGIWVAGALRPDVTPEQIRAFRASAISGDWRIIKGQRELVAACAVNVPGFPVVRAMVAGGAITALVAAGARPLAERRAAMTANAGLLERVEALETQLKAQEPGEVILDAIIEPADTTSDEDGKEEDAQVAPAEPVAAAAVEAVEAPAVVDEPVAAPAAEEPELTEAELARAEQIRNARAMVSDVKRAALRATVHGEPVTAAAVTVKGSDSFPISDVASLRKAIQAFGRAGDKEAAKKHIKSMAFKLKRPDLIPAGWK